MSTTEVFTRQEFLKIFDAVKEVLYTEYDFARKSDPETKVPDFNDIMTKTLQFAWYVDQYIRPQYEVNVPESNGEFAETVVPHE